MIKKEIKGERTKAYFMSLSINHLPSLIYILNWFKILGPSENIYLDLVSLKRGGRWKSCLNVPRNLLNSPVSSSGLSPTSDTTPQKTMSGVQLSELNHQEISAQRLQEKFEQVSYGTCPVRKQEPLAIQNLWQNYYYKHFMSVTLRPNG